MNHRFLLARATLRTALAALVSLAAPLAAHAGAGTLLTTVSALSDTVTYSINGTPSSGSKPATKALLTYVGYQVTIKNDGGNTINNVRFTGTVTDLEPSQKAVFSTAEGATCVATNADGTAIECGIGQLKAGESAAPFRVFFLAPTKAATNLLNNGTVDATGACTGDCLVFSGVSFYAEGTGGVNSVPQNSTDIWPSVNVALGTANPMRVKSAVPKAGGEFFTGNQGLPIVNDLVSDPFASTVVVPVSAASTTAEILESSFGLAEGCVNFTSCYASVITVPPPVGSTSFSPFLRITLRVDATNIKSGTKGPVRIETIVPTYNGEPIYACGGVGSPRTDGKPCIESRQVYGKGGKVPEGLEGDYEWVFLNIVNGSYRLP